MQARFIPILFLLACTLVGCSQGYHWAKSHPAYNKAPYGKLSIDCRQDAFVLTRTSWFAKRLDYGDSTQIKATSFCAKVMLDELAKGYTELDVLPQNSMDGFPEESQKIDDRIFMKGRLPEQGVTVKDSAGNIPAELLLIHEVIVGTDLKREDFFDYALIHNESEEKATVKDISAIVSYTLWDNLKQRALFSAVDEIQHPVVRFEERDLELLIRAAAQNIRKNLYTGVVK